MTAISLLKVTLLAIHAPGCWYVWKQLTINCFFSNL